MAQVSIAAQIVDQSESPAPAAMFAPAVPAADAASGAPRIISAAGAASGAARIIIDGGLPAGVVFSFHAVQARLREAKLPTVSWHTILNNNTSKRPKCHGGPLCRSLKACKEFSTRGSEHVCRLVLPNSYERDDGLVVSAAALASTKDAASQDVCFFVFALLCANKVGLPNVVFRPAHWNVQIEDLFDDIRRMVDPDPSATYQPLAVNQSAAASVWRDGCRRTSKCSPR